jgi:hypothetical protein
LRRSIANISDVQIIGGNMAEHPSPNYIRKIRNDIENYRATVRGLEEEVCRYKKAGDEASARSMREEIRRTEQSIANLEAQLP